MTVQRIYPEGKTALINWIEENFHEIDSFVATFTMKDDEEITTIHHCNSWLEAMGITTVAINTMNEIGASGEFAPKEKD